jgi:AraC family transcriptional regulator, regulatory protein of adaptative response / methylated-DNA-[protein]-cysteine methyltransferase
METLEDVRWRAVATRDRAMADVFVYAVTTTKIYCRPGCASRRPRRANVEYFATGVEAASAGYRACRRCRPDDQRLSDPGVAAVIALCRRLSGRDASASVAEMASDLGYTERHLQRRFREIVGVSIGEYRRSMRVERVRGSVRDGASVTGAVLDAGFGSTRAFYDNGADRMGMSPSQFRRGGPGERIGFTTMSTPLGVALVARTARGVCSVQLGDDEAALEAQLRCEFPMAEVVRDDDGLIGEALVVARGVRGDDGATELPVDLAGTALQMRVWEALRTIPSGETRTYSEVAAEVGRPNAVRAVASACAANTVALAVPCHRVVRRDGALGGYRWGVERKRSLLGAEGALREG